MDYCKYLKNRLKNLKDLLSKLDENENEQEVLLSNINSIRNPIFEILDYSVNHFKELSGQEKNIYFPLLDTNYKKGDLQKHKHHKAIVSLNNQLLDKYIDESYKIIFSQKYDCCILLLASSTKHRNQDDILSTKRSFKMNSIGNKIDVEQDIYGGINIGNFIKSDGGSRIKIENCILENPKGMTIIQSFETCEIDGNSLIINNKGRKFRVNIRPFLKKCINCTEEIIIIWEKYQTYDKNI